MAFRDWPLSISFSSASARFDQIWPSNQSINDVDIEDHLFRPRSRRAIDSVSFFFSLVFWAIFSSLALLGFFFELDGAIQVWLVLIDSNFYLMGIANSHKYDSLV